MLYSDSPREMMQNAVNESFWDAHGVEIVARPKTAPTSWVVKMVTQKPGFARRTSTAPEISNHGWSKPGSCNVPTHTHTRTHARTCTHTHMHTHAHTHTHTRTHTHTHTPHTHTHSTHTHHTRTHTRTKSYQKVTVMVLIKNHPDIIEGVSRFLIRLGV